MDMDFYKGKKVFVTGHTGFKGSWMCETLLNAGAQVTGYSLETPAGPSLFQILGLHQKMNSLYGDVRDLQKLEHAFRETRPEIVIHMAAQPLVRESYQNPVYTYDVNVMGTVNVLECVRHSDSVRSVINVTTDKVYKNREWEWGYRENEELDGFDPYSNSKSCSELVTGSYKNSFFAGKDIAVSTVRAGNVIGGGDFAADRIIPDCVRAAQKKETIIVRNPHSVRPYQHVLEPVVVYLDIAMKQYENVKLAGSYNVGPEEKDCLTTANLVELFCESWKAVTGEPASWEDRSDGGPHEARFLKLDCSKLRTVFDWNARWNIKDAVHKSVEVYAAYCKGGDVEGCMKRQIGEMLAVP